MGGGGRGGHARRAGRVPHDLGCQEHLARRVVPGHLDPRRLGGGQPRERRTGNGFGTGTKLDALATLAKLSDVADRAAEKLGLPGDPADLADKMTFEADSTAGLFRITADGEPRRSGEPGQRYAGALVEFMADGIRQARSDRAEALAPQVQSLNKDMADLQAKIDTAPQSQLQP